MKENFKTAYFEAIGSWFSSWSFLSKNKLLHFFLYPIIISILLSMGAVALIRQAVQYIMSFVEPWIDTPAIAGDTWWQKTLEFLSSIGSYAVAFMIWMLSLYLFSKIHKYIVLIVMSPVMALLSEKTDAIVTGRNVGFEFAQLIKDIFRGVVIAIRSMIAELFLGLVIWIAGIYLTFIFPPLALLIGPATLILSFFISAYFFGFSILDYTNERRKLGISESIKKIRDNKGLAAGTGSVFIFLTMIPFIGVTIATITCTVSGTILYLKK